MNSTTAALERIEACIQNGPYSDDWASLSGYQTPQWYQDAKFGIFIHWGVYSVPAFDNEWYPRSMYMQDNPVFQHHLATYGPHKKFGYKDFIPLFRAENFSAGEWARLFRESGAKYIMPVAEHHDGFQMYNSRLSRWNAQEMGPKKDILGELFHAFKQQGLHCCASSHRIEHWFFMGHARDFDSDLPTPLTREDLYWPAMPDPDFHNPRSEPAPSQEFLEDWLLRCCELVDQYQPEALYFDWWILHSAAEPYLKKFAAYYYNQAAAWGRQVVINYKHDSFHFGCAVPDMERGQFSAAKPFYWQSDTSVALNSWCYTENNRYKSAQELLWALIDVVSKNGNLLLNIGPKADGSIPEQDAALLRAIGGWLQTGGEGIFGSRVWRISSEGPTRTADGQFTDSQGISYTSQDFRFTVNGDSLYAFAMKWPEDGNVQIRSFAKADDPNSSPFQGLIDSVTVLGSPSPTTWHQDEAALHVHASGVDTSLPVAIRIKIA